MIVVGKVQRACVSPLVQEAKMTLKFIRSSGDSEDSPCLGGGGKMLGVRRRLSLDALMVFWGLGTWVGVNGLFVQLPLLVERLPEGWALGSAMALSVQAANIGPLAWAALQRLVRRGRGESIGVGTLLAAGAAALLLCAPLYSRTVIISGSPRSVPLLTFTFVSGLVGCTSSVLFYPYLRHFRPAYLPTYLVGEALSGFLPSVLALAQGVGGEPTCVTVDDGSLVPEYPPPRFNAATFILVLGALALLSLVSFIIIDRWSGFASERVFVEAKTGEESTEKERVVLWRGVWGGALAALTAVNALNNGVLPALQPFACRAYGARAHHLAAALGAAAAPAACLAAATATTPKGRWPRGALAAAAAALPPAAYITAAALLSPAPPLVHTVIGEVLVVSYKHLTHMYCALMLSPVAHTTASATMLSMLSIQDK
ncbi:hypothetical protein ACJJTC_015141 [Scirpophaga incertulas]